MSDDEMEALFDNAIRECQAGTDERAQMVIGVLKAAARAIERAYPGVSPAVIPGDGANEYRLVLRGRPTIVLVVEVYQEEHFVSTSGERATDRASLVQRVAEGLGARIGAVAAVAAMEADR